MAAKNKDYEELKELDASANFQGLRGDYQTLAEHIRDKKIGVRWVRRFRCTQDGKLIGGLIVLPDGERAIYHNASSRQDTQVAVERQTKIVERLDQWIKTRTPPAWPWPARVERTVDGVPTIVEPKQAQLHILRRHAAQELEDAKKGDLPEPIGLIFIRWQTDDRQVRPRTVELGCPRCHQLIRVAIEPDGTVLELE